MNPTIKYPGYSVEISDHLLHPFRQLATVLAVTGFNHPLDVCDHPRLEEVVLACIDCILAAIGKQYAHDSCLGDAVWHWRALGDLEKVELVIKAALATKPLDIGYMLETGGRTNLS